MILPTKHLPVERSLIGVGAEILLLLDQPKAVTNLWVDFQEFCKEKDIRLTFDWFTLTISMLYAVGAVEMKNKRLHRCEVVE